jgi:hypothetical protein
MDIGQITLISSRLALGAAASFFAIMLWSKTRDVAWMLMVVGTIAAYAETVYSILDRLGVSRLTPISLGSVSLPALVLPNLPTVFYIAAFAVMVVRKTRKR